MSNVHRPARPAALVAPGSAKITLQDVLPRRLSREVKNMTTLTGWDLDDVRRRMHLVSSEVPNEDRKWWS